MSREAMKHIKTWSERCEEHPDHQQGMISERMIQARMQEEIDELRQALETEKLLCEEMLRELYVYRASEYLRDVTAAIRARSKQ